MRKRRMVKNIIMTLMIICCLLTFGAESISVSAQERENEVIYLDRIEDIQYYDSEDGNYAAYLEDGSSISVKIDTVDYNSEKNSTYSGEQMRGKIYEYNYWYPDGSLNWSSTLEAVFVYNGTYVYCISGTAYSKFGDRNRSSISYDMNTYSSAKVTGSSKYIVKAKIVTPAGIYYITQSIACDPYGKEDCRMVL